MDVGKQINEISELLDEALADVPDNPIFEQYKSRNIANYSIALKNLWDIQKGGNKNEKQNI